MLGFLRGKSGELRAGYQSAARIGPWTATKSSSGNFVVEGEALSVDSYWIKHKPLELRLFLGSMYWRWIDVEVQSANGRLLITTKGPRQK